MKTKAGKYRVNLYDGKTGKRFDSVVVVALSKEHAAQTVKSARAVPPSAVLGVKFISKDTRMNPLRKRTPKFPVGKSGAYAFDEGHVHIGKGLVYCKQLGESAPPVLTHSRVKCALCGKTIQSATNPARKYKFPGIAPLGKWKIWRGMFRSKGAAEDNAKIVREMYGHPTKVSLGINGYWDILYLPDEKNPFIGVAYRQTPTARRRRSLKNPVPSYALLLRRKLSQGYAPEEARGMAERELEQANIFLRLPRKNPAAAQIRRAAQALVDSRFVTPDTARRVVSEALTYGMDRLPGRVRDMMNSALSYLPRQNPGHGRRVSGVVTSPRLIYGRASTLTVGPDGKVKQMTSRKTSGPYKGKDFVHEFKPGVKHIGLPRGTTVSTPDGQSFNLKTRTALMVGPKNLWADFAA